MKKELILEGKFEDVYKMENHFYLKDKKDKLCVLPYTISSSGLIDNIGVIEEYNYIEAERVLTLLYDYINEDDETDLVAANRILYEVIATNVTEASLWMYLGNVYNIMSSESPIKIYCVNVTNVEVKADEEVEEQKERKRFKLIDSTKVTQSDDVLFLAGFLRLFNYMYKSSLKDE